MSLLAAGADTTRTDELLDDAKERLRQALLLQPSSERAKWNLELTERRAPAPATERGWRRRRWSAAIVRWRRTVAARSQSESRGQGLSQSQAEQILNSMERRERETRAEQQRRLQSGSAGGVKDW